MLITQDWFRVHINFEPFWEKPPLFFWMQVACMKLFGVNEYAARLPNAICGIITLQVIFAIGESWRGRLFGWAWALLYLGSFLPHLYFKSGIIDPWFNLFIFLSIYFLFLTIEHPKKSELKYAALAGLFSGLAVLTKGPVGFLLLLLTFLVWWVFNRFKRPASIWAILIFAITTALVSTLWFGYETIKNGPWFLVEFIQYQIELFSKPVAGHAQPFYYHFVVVLLGCFPLSVIALPAFKRSFTGDKFKLSQWMKFLFWVVMILFSIVTTKIVHYSSMAYLPLSYLAANVALSYLERRKPIQRWMQWWFIIQGGLLTLVFIALPIVIHFKDQFIPLIKDEFAQGNLSAEVSWGGWEWIVGVFYAVVLFFTINQSRRLELKRAFLTLTLGTAIVIFSLLNIIVPKVEGYSQRSAIEFYESHQDEDVYFDTYKFKSYAHYFYGRITPETAYRGTHHDLNKANKSVLVSLKTNRKEEFEEEYPESEFLYEKGGFRFYRIEQSKP